MNHLHENEQALLRQMVPARASKKQIALLREQGFYIAAHYLIEEG